MIREELRQKRQAYVVCPIIEESEKLDLKAAQKTFEHLKKEVFPQFNVDLLHGRMKSEEKERVMKFFQTGKTQVLVSTTVVEVGVDVPNATVMMVEHAERFGLSQLHQLRGRIGRGSASSICLLIKGKKLSNEAEERLQCMVENTDGFKIAEKDLEIRGPGEFFGTRQSGVPTLRIANLLRDREILESARRGGFQLPPESIFRGGSEGPDCLREGELAEAVWAGRRRLIPETRCLPNGGSRALTIDCHW